MQKIVGLLLIGLLVLFFFTDQLNFFGPQDMFPLPEPQVVKKNPSPTVSPTPREWSQNEKLPPAEKDFQKKLRDTFSLHQRFIEKCFIRHYERAEGQTQSGQVLAQFSMGKKGRLEKISIPKSDYQDEKFHDCVKEVLSRVKIKFYDGKERSIQFPISLKIPGE